MGVDRMDEMIGRMLMTAEFANIGALSAMPFTLVRYCAKYQRAYADKLRKER